MRRITCSDKRKRTPDPLDRDNVEEMEQEMSQEGDIEMKVEYSTVEDSVSNANPADSAHQPHPAHWKVFLDALSNEKATAEDKMS